MSTTEQQGVTVAHDITRNPAAIWLSPICDDTAHHGEGRTWAAPSPDETCEDCGERWVKYVRVELASVSSVSAGMKPWRGGDVRPADWNPTGDAIMVDPSDMHISVGPVPEQMPWKQTVGWKVIVAYTPTPEPVPATNQAGEVINRRRLALEDADALDRIAEDADDNGWQDWGAMMRQSAMHTRAALATQPATSQEGEVCALCSGKGFADAQCPVCMIAATPTPPTLSEDLREALVWAVAHIEGRTEYDREEQYGAALARANLILNRATGQAS